MPINYRSVDVDGLKVFYREAGPRDAPVLLLLHGFPTSSHMFRGIIPMLSDRVRLIAPDLPGFGRTELPPRDKFKFTFANIASVVERFVEVIDLTRFSVYIFDYGAPTGLRLALRVPDKIEAIISQNGNAYVEGLSDGWKPMQAYWEDPSDKNRNALRPFLSPETTIWQYTTGVSDTSLVSPDGYSLDNYYLNRPGVADAQLDLFGDYKSNVTMYPDFQQYFRTRKPPLLAVWGKHDPFFLPPGAEAFKRDIPSAEVRFFDTGHFALETHGQQIADAIRDFLVRIKII
jgi:pimeloyl-ACP methyl ester carboxylesterase